MNSTRSTSFLLPTVRDVMCLTITRITTRSLNRLFSLYQIGDTGANMKVCLKLPARNLVLDPSPSILAVSSNMAADVLLNGQGNSGTILSHFFVSLAEECRTCGKASLEVNEFAKVLALVGGKMS